MLLNKSYTFFLKLFSILIGILFSLIIIPSNVKAWVIIFLSITLLILWLQRGFVFQKQIFVLNAFLYFLLLATLIYSEDMDYAIKKLSTMSPLIVFPIIFSTLNKNEISFLISNLKKYLLAYIVSTFLFCTVIFFYLLVNEGDLLNTINLFPKRIITNIGKYGMHPIYLSIQLGIAVLFSIHILHKEKNKLLRFFLVLIIIPFLFFLIMLSNKGVIIALLTILILYVLFAYRRKFLSRYLVLFTAIFFIIFSIPKTRNSFIELVKIESIKTAEITPSNIRFTIYNTCQSLVEKSFLFGYGIGDYNYTLMDEYKKDGNQLLYEGKYNAHNQYLSLLLIGGIILLIAFILMIGINLVFAIRYNNQLLILLIVFYGIVMFTENILEREIGVIFFAFFLNFFSLKSLYLREEN